MKHRKHVGLYIQTMLIIIIAISLLFLTRFTNNKLRELESSSKEAMMLNENLMSSNKEELSKQLMTYRPEAYKRVEIYDENFNLIFSIILDNYNVAMNIKEYPQLMNELKTKSEGQATFEQNNYEANIYFKWNNDEGKKMLYIIYTRRSLVKDLWLFNFIAGGIMCLILILFLLNHFIIYKLSNSYYSLLLSDMKNNSSR